ncbi:MAG: N-acetylneuraminate synthase family protein [Candidatus Omnitrophica bacterium]|nr:N-acetylneuraminate synthase family protein [Candidatus Omnitrophota bacterium]MBI2174544.1 N-acetylneuraminate synthase family protein [Candidatus Omnitrophota bacterium]MBI3010229.1 N-acetylneuraminate synthase family protein [Candidatus Omnitrophota bacterium]
MIEPVKIGNRLVGPGHRPFIIAEAAVNHQGDVEHAKRMVYLAHAVGADAIKFQLHLPDREMLRTVPSSSNFKEPLYDILIKTHLDIDEHRQLKRLCEQLGILYLCTPFSREASDLLEELGVLVFKTGSGELTNLPLQAHIAKKGKPMIVSTGMCTVEEIQETVDLIKKIGTPLILTHCVSAYPTPYPLVNLGMIPTYTQRFSVPVGLSDHSRGIYTALGAVALGACVLEKHYTLDRLQEGPDHPVSIEPNELAELVKGSGAIFQAMGYERRIFKEEAEIVAWARESVVSEVPILKGQVIREEMVWVKRPGPGQDGIPAKALNQVIGSVARQDIPKDTQLRWKDLEQKTSAVPPSTKRTPRSAARPTVVTNRR